MLPNKEHLEQLDEVIALKKELDEMRDLLVFRTDENNVLRAELEEKNTYIHHLEGKVEAYEFCVKHGRVK